MEFYNPSQTATIEGRIPTKEDNFSEDRYYSNIENVFVRFDPLEKFIQVTFPCESEVVLKYSYDSLNELAKSNVTILDFIRNADNVEEVLESPTYRCVRFSTEKDIFIKYKENLQ